MVRQSKLHATRDVLARVRKDHGRRHLPECSSAVETVRNDVLELRENGPGAEDGYEPVGDGLGKRHSDHLTGCGRPSGTGETCAWATRARQTRTSRVPRRPRTSRGKAAPLRNPLSDPGGSQTQRGSHAAGALYFFVYHASPRPPRMTSPRQTAARVSGGTY